MALNYTIRPATEAENFYSIPLSAQLCSQTGCMGYLRGDFGSGGDEFWTNWFDKRADLKTPEFKEEFDNLINSLRFGNGEGPSTDAMFSSRGALKRYCWNHPEAQMKSETNFDTYGFRADTETFSYMFRFTPQKGMYDIYCYCYRRDWLQQHMKRAESGIRFPDASNSFETAFMLPDNGKIKITHSDGTVDIRWCRYIDAAHMELYDGSCSLYHIDEFAEKMLRSGAKVEPLTAQL